MNESGAAWQPTLKCDAVGCDHVEEIEALTEDLIGKPCPKCGADLLTREDYTQGAALEAMMNALLKGIPAVKPGPGIVQVNVGVHDGEFTMRVKPSKGDA